MATDRETFLGLLDAHGAAALALLRRLCGNAHDADDVFQDAAVRAWRHLGARPRLRSARAWLMTIAYRAFLDHQSRRTGHAPLADHDPPAEGGRASDPVALVEQAERRLQLDDAVAGLAPAVRDVVLLHYTGGLSLREVAAALGIAPGTAKSRLHAGLEQLRRRLPCDATA